jgi:tripartite motif-containing protein 71
MTVNGISTSSGQASEEISLNVGPNPITIVVTAQNGSTKTYLIMVTREARVEVPSGGGGPTAPSSNPVISTDGHLTLPVGTGGKVSLQNEMTVSVPADASAQELNITIDKVLDTQNLLTDKEVLVSPIFEILKNFSENFSKPVTLTFAFDPNSLKSGERASVFYYDEEKKEWVEVGGVVSGNQITAEVDHFTKFAVLAVEQAAEAKADFSDIAGHWAEVNIKQVVNEGIVRGYPDGTFKPNRAVTRAEFAVMLMNALKPSEEGAALTFADAAKIPAWEKQAVTQAVEAGIINGYDDGTFRPDVEITRAEMASMVAKAFKLTLEENAATGFADDMDIPAWAKGAVAALKKLGLMDGTGANRFNADSRATRAEAVTILLRMLEQQSK